MEDLVESGAVNVDVDAVAHEITVHARIPKKNVRNVGLLAVVFLDRLRMFLDLLVRQW